MGLFNKGSKRVHCPSCGAKNDADIERCRICTGFMQNEDGSLRGLNNGPAGNPVDDRDIEIPETTSTIAMAEKQAAAKLRDAPDGENAEATPEAGAAASYGDSPVHESVSNDEPAPFDFDALEIESSPQAYQPAETMAEALPSFDEEEPRPGRLDPSRLPRSSTGIVTPDSFGRIGFGDDQPDENQAFDADTIERF